MFAVTMFVIINLNWKINFLKLHIDVYLVSKKCGNYVSGKLEECGLSTFCRHLNILYRKKVAKLYIQI